MVLDERPHEQSFLAFFAEMASKIGPMMQAVEITTNRLDVVLAEVGDARRVRLGRIARH